MPRHRCCSLDVEGRAVLVKGHLADDGLVVLEMCEIPGSAEVPAEVCPEGDGVIDLGASSD
jgi:hypothetical protein